MPKRIREPSTVGDLLRSYRRERGLTQEALAAAAGFDRTYVGMVERGERKPTVDAVTHLLDALGISWTRMGAALDAARAEAGKTGQVRTPARR